VSRAYVTGHAKFSTKRLRMRAMTYINIQFSVYHVANSDVLQSMQGSLSDKMEEFESMKWTLKDRMET